MELCKSLTIRSKPIKWEDRFGPKKCSMDPFKENVFLGIKNSLRKSTNESTLNRREGDTYSKDEQLQKEEEILIGSRSTKGGQTPEKEDKDKGNFEDEIIKTNIENNNTTKVEKGSYSNINGKIPKMGN